jgi:hypothetical protein
VAHSTPVANPSHLKESLKKILACRTGIFMRRWERYCFGKFLSAGNKNILEKYGTNYYKVHYINRNLEFESKRRKDANYWYIIFEQFFSFVNSNSNTDRCSRIFGSKKLRTRKD